MVEKKTSVRSQDPGQRRVLDPAARQRCINRQLEALENDSFQDDPRVGLPQLGKRLPQFDDDADTGKKKKKTRESADKQILPSLPNPRNSRRSGGPTPPAPIPGQEQSLLSTHRCLGGSSSNSGLWTRCHQFLSAAISSTDTTEAAAMSPEPGRLLMCNRISDVT
ncbi:unnamed protein product [Rangifer tarandus platyrhynchus]|uniref:Uncharacterized protein n=2 Tax=Rangifer tarandus platyrhynchus TaxID=3082113 RepID=A0ABN8ZS98_RANTA|nr:unnamed protein product [Rangifer tarandus platyrhynchus]CAI9709864.1 unnamed protein product [Rangifer tarandus platyrhynchus]